jgi:hypothetical protein
VRRVGLLASVVVTLVAAYGLLVVGPVGTHGGPARAQAAEQQLDTRQGLYPRVIRLEHSGPANGRIIASVSASSTGGVTDIARIYESTDAGASFHQIGEVHDPQADGGRGTCCGSLFELPRQLAAQPEGTLLFGTTVGLKNSAPGRQPAIRVWSSADGGHTWTYLSSCAVAADSTPSDQGMWEPEFSVHSRGATSTAISPTRRELASARCWPP